MLARFSQSIVRRLGALTRGPAYMINTINKDQNRTTREGQEDQKNRNSNDKTDDKTYNDRSSFDRSTSDRTLNINTSDKSSYNAAVYHRDNEKKQDKKDDKSSGDKNTEKRNQNTISRDNEPGQRPMQHPTYQRSDDKRPGQRKEGQESWNPTDIKPKSAQNPYYNEKNIDRDGSSVRTPNLDSSSKTYPSGSVYSDYPSSQQQKDRLSRS